MPRPDLADVMALVGWLMVGYALGSVSLVLGIGVLGGILLLLGLLGAWRKGGRT